VRRGRVHRAIGNGAWSGRSVLTEPADRPVRRNNLLKLLEYYCPASDDNSSIPKAEYKKVEQNETIVIVLGAPTQQALPTISPALPAIEMEPADE
jgi:hypothetical protein